MDSLLRRQSTLAIEGVPSFLREKLLQRWQPNEPYSVIWWILVSVISISFVPSTLTDASPLLTVAVAVFGAAGCGWMWLLARSLFRPSSKISRQSIVIIGAIIAIEAVARLKPTLAASGVHGELLRLISNTESFVCISVIAFVFVEALYGYGPSMGAGEKRFRLSFAIGLGVVIAIAIIWGSGLGETTYGHNWANTVSQISGLASIIGTRLAVEFRKRHPLVAVKTAKQQKAPRAKNEDLSKRILMIVKDDDFLTNAEVKVADMAASLGVHEYLISQCITGDLGFRNFNHLINTHRIHRVKILLKDPGSDRKRISTIAFDCGFNSIGTFNRTFKNEVGVTPREFLANGAIDTPILNAPAVPPG